MSLSNNPTISAAPAQRASLVDGLHGRSRLAVALVSFVLVVLIGAANGGYFPTSWGWCVLAFTWIAGLTFIFATRLTLGRLELLFLAALLLLAGWTALSILWSSDVESSVLQVQRATVYVSAVLAMLLVVRATAVPHLLAGLLAGVTWLATQALASRLFPDAPAGLETIMQDRLNGAISYANALGLVTVMAALLALVMAVHARRLFSRAAAACTLPVLLTAAYFTFSRGAGLAFAVGLLAAIVVDGLRLKLVTTGLLVAAPAVAAVLLASGAPALTSSTASVARVADEGQGLAVVLLALTLTTALIALAIGRLEPRVRIPVGVRRGYAALLAIAALAVLGGVVMEHGGPGPLVKDAYQGLNRERLPADQTEANDLNRRLGSIGTTARVNFWRVAWTQHEEHPWIGSGAGTYEQFWLRDRPLVEQAVDGHSIYLETLAELGWPGLIFVVTLLLLPLAAVRRARRQPLIAGAAGVYAAYLFHAGIDWDWEMPSVTLLALACAVALLVAARDDGRRSGDRPLTARGRAAGLTACVALSVFAIVGLVGNRALAEATRDVTAREFRDARAAAQIAVRWAPWSAEAHHQLGLAQAGMGRKEEGRERLAKASRMDPGDWQIWYDLGILSSGRQRQSAFVQAARLNPLQDEITALRKRGYSLPLAGKAQ